MATTTSRKIFVNLAVADLPRSVEFFTKLGFTFEPRFTDENATCMIVSDEAFVMLLVGPRFMDFTKKKLCDSHTHTEAILAFSAETRDEADALADRAIEVGGSPANEPMDMGFMYGRSFYDPDGHLWDVAGLPRSARTVARRPLPASGAQAARRDARGSTSRAARGGRRAGRRSSYRGRR